jgi:hypothetical protein
LKESPSDCCIYLFKVDEMKRLYENKLAELNERAKTAKQHDRSGILRSELGKSGLDSSELDR